MAGYETNEQQRIRATLRRSKQTKDQKRFLQLKQKFGEVAAIVYLNAKECEVCGFKREPHYCHIHHKDHNSKNNSPDNLIALCYYCHRDIHLLEGYK